MILQIIRELGSTRSRNEKENILRREVANEDLQRFFFLSLSPFQNYFQKKNFKQRKVGGADLRMCMDALDANIAKRVLTGNDSFEYITAMINSLSEDDAKIIMLILQADSGCDLGAATINKIWPKLIPTYPTLLATEYDEKLAAKLDWKRGVFVQNKSDGLRINLVFDEVGLVKGYSRAGNELNFFGVFDYLGEFFKGVVIDGELLTVNAEGKFNSRQISNGICSKAIKNTMSEVESQSLHITAWDAIPLVDFIKEKSQLEYKDRFKILSDLIDRARSKISTNAFDKHISIIPSRIVHSIEQTQQYYEDAIAFGEEGLVIKQQSMLWSDSRSNLQLKMKAKNTGDFKVTGYKDGVGKFLGNLGSLVIATSDDKLEANMSGFSFKLRSEIYANLTGNPVNYSMVEDGIVVTKTALPGESDINIGSIIEAAYNAKIKSRDSDIWSIFLPRFQTIRIDKDIANTIEELK